MHVFKNGRRHSRTTKIMSLVQFLVAVLAVLFAGAMLSQAMGKGDESEAANRIFFGVAVLAFVAQGFQSLSVFFGKPKARVILTSNTLAVKFRKKPAQFFKRSACLAYAPERMVFHFENGMDFSPRIFVLVLDDWKEIPAFIFEQWWSLSALETMKKALEDDLPITRRMLIFYFGGIFVFFVLGMTAIIGGMTGLLEPTTVYGLLGATVVVSFDWLMRHRRLLRREKEREGVRFALPPG